MSDEPQNKDREEQVEDLDVAPEAAEDVKGGRDVATGQATGKRQYADFSFTHYVDKASPSL